MADGYCNSRVVSFTPNGTFQAQFELPGSAALAVPHSLVLDECRNTLYVADRESSQVHSFDLGNHQLTGVAIELMTSVGRDIKQAALKPGCCCRPGPGTLQRVPDSMGMQMLKQVPAATSVTLLQRDVQSDLPAATSWSASFRTRSLAMIVLQPKCCMYLLTARFQTWLYTSCTDRLLVLHRQ